MPNENDPKTNEESNENTPNPAQPTEPAEQEKGEEEAEKGAEEEVVDTHGQVGINKERHDKEVAALNEQIADLKGKLEEAAKTEAGRKDLQAQLDKLKADMEDERVTHELEMAGCLDAKMAKAVLDDYKGDIQKLKAEKAWLFGAKTGTTGGKPAGTPNDEDFDKKLDKAFGLTKE